MIRNKKIKDVLLFSSSLLLLSKCNIVGQWSTVGIIPTRYRANRNVLNSLNFYKENIAILKAQIYMLIGITLMMYYQNDVLLST